MISKTELQLIRSLRQKKQRVRLGLFVVEGDKVIKEFLEATYMLERLYTTHPDSFTLPDSKLRSITPETLRRISFQKTPNRSLALFHLPEPTVYVDEGLIVVLDDLQDPGNLGTIVRLCDWFGAEQVVCSPFTVDAYGPKVVQASAGSLVRVHMLYMPLTEILKKTRLPIYGAYMNGDSVYQADLPEQGILVLGNEGNGISEEVGSYVTHRISIPRYDHDRKAESLNVAMAAAILLSAFRGR